MPAVRQNRQPAASLARHHLLILDSQISFDEVEYLALTRYPHARWIDEEVLQLSRHSSLRGPVAIETQVATQLGLGDGVDPAHDIVIYIADCPTDRGDPPLPGVGDRDGVSRAFPDQMPHMEEGRIIEWLIATARRLGGSVRASGTGVVLRPDPLTSVDLTVSTDVWLDPAAALAVIRQVLPRAFIDSIGSLDEGAPPRSGRRSAWSSVAAGADPSLSEPSPSGANGLDIDELADIHQIAQLHDDQALAMPVVLESYAIRAPLGDRPDLDGECYVVVGGANEVPQALAGLEWAVGGVISYQIAWSPIDDIQLHVEFPNAEHCAARERVIPLIGAVTYLIQEAAGGEITDMDGFLVSVEDLLPWS